ncbi:MAG: universal stress protein [Pseudomonadota bacterium]
MFKTIVVGIDGSGPSQNAVRMACDLAGKYDSTLALVHTPQPQTVAFALGAMAGYHAVTTMPDPDEVKRAAAKVMDAASAIAAEAGVTITAQASEQGDPATQIVAMADDTGADLIVMGRRGLGGVGALFMGSTSQDVAHKAKCAMLTVA